MPFFRTVRRRAVTAGVLLLCTGLSIASAGLGGQAKRSSHPPLAEPATPFCVGEKLDYRIGWNTLVTAATTRLAVVERRPFFGGEAWHFQVVARTVEPMRYLFALDDQFDSYADIVTLASRQYEMYLHEQGKRESSVVRMSTEGEPARGDGPSVRVLPGTRDPLSALYALRAMDWQRTRETRMHVYDGKKLYEIRARLEQERGEVQVPAGTFSARRIALRVYERGREVTETRLSLWLALDAARTPVLIEAEVPIGSVRAELTRAQP